MIRKLPPDLTAFPCGVVYSAIVAWSKRWYHADECPNLTTFKVQLTIYLTDAQTPPPDLEELAGRQ
jgi:hypothetical protein